MATEKTYEEVESGMTGYVEELRHPEEIRHEVWKWILEYSEENHKRMVNIAELVKKIEVSYDHEDFDVPDEDKAVIHKIGCDIDEEGGFEAQEACFHVATNFLTDDAELKKKLKAIQVCWNKAGEWRY